MAIERAATLRATDAVRGIPRDADGPVFREPWEAQAFALAVTLHEAGCFTWAEWSRCLAEAIRAAQAAGDPDHGESYYRHWLAALERLLAAKGLVAPAALAQRISVATASDDDDRPEGPG